MLRSSIFELRDEATSQRYYFRSGLMIQHERGSVKVGEVLTFSQFRYRGARLIQLQPDLFFLYQRFQGGTFLPPWVVAQQTRPAWLRAPRRSSCKHLPITLR